METDWQESIIIYLNTAQSMVNNSVIVHITYITCIHFARIHINWTTDENTLEYVKLIVDQ